MRKVHMFVRWCIVVLLAGALLAALPAPASASDQRWLVVGDVHFDPFADGTIAPKLVSAPVERWRAILADGGPKPFSGYAGDTNYALLESALGAMRNAVDEPQVVIVAGDFLTHDFREKFARASNAHDEASYEAFVDKTIAFLAQEFQLAFPHARILPVIGESDGYCGEFQNGASTAFLAHMSAEWAGSLGASNPQAFMAQFATGGYYDTPLPAGNAHAIVLNDVFWSASFKDACAHPAGDPGSDEFAWLARTMKADAAAPVWIIAHIPPGIDAFATLHSGTVPPAVVPFLDERAQNTFVNALTSQAPPVVMALAAHTHTDSFRIVASDAGGAQTPMLVVPSLSPAASTNPAFEVLDVDSATAAVNDLQVWVLHGLADLAKDAKRVASWKREYDFDAIFGHGPITADHLFAIQQAMFSTERVRRRYAAYYDSGSGRVPIDDSNWRAYWCANVALTVTTYTACAMPQIQRQLPPHPAPPPSPSPSP
jgi:predicted phosphodiesterase